MTTEPTPEPALPDRIARMGRLIAFQSRLKTFIDQERPALFQQMREAQKVTSGKAYSHNFGEKSAVTFTIKEEDDTVIVSDSDALLAWVEENAPSEIETVFQVRPAFKAALLKRVKGTDVGVFDPETGAEVPGLKFVPAPPPSNFNTSWKGDGKSLALGEVLAAGTDELLGIEGGDQA